MHRTRLKSWIQWSIRLLLGMIFVAGGLPKLLGQPWHRVSHEPWIVPFFEALSSSGIYWNFLGFCQVAAGILIVIPRTATLGALVYLPVAANVFMIAVSLPFNSGVIGFTGAMLAGNLYLLGLDADRLQPILAPRPDGRPQPSAGTIRATLYAASATACAVIAFHVVLVVAR